MNIDGLENREAPMLEENIIISNPSGLHTRPGKRVVAEAKKFGCAIIIRNKDKSADLKSLIKLMKLGISYNHRIRLICDGPDEAEAMAHLKDFITKLED
jgi:phosphotransferase system HPr (HPr) family protein